MINFIKEEYILIYLNSLPDDIEEIDISNKNIIHLPTMKRFKNLKILNLGFNQIITLPQLPDSLEVLYCNNNRITLLSSLPKNLVILDIKYNKLTSLPNLPDNLQELICSSNKLVSLPNSLKNLKIINCSNNQITSLPLLNNKIDLFNYVYNPIYEVINNNNIEIIKNKVEILYNFRHIFYTIKLKKQLKDWLWLKVREPIAKKKYHPNYLLKNLTEDKDLDDFLQNWI